MRRLILAIIGTVIIVGVIFFITSTHDVLPPLPQGVQQVSGHLERAELSRVRRGTHKLTAGSGTILAYVESTSVLLRSLEDSDVVLEGMYERNVDPKDPLVLVVSKLVSGGPTTLRPVTIKTPALSLEVPENWRLQSQELVSEFSVDTQTGMILRVESVSMSALPFDFRTFTPVGNAELKVQPTVVANETSALTWDPAFKQLAVYVQFGSGKVAKGPAVVRLAFPNSEWGPGVIKNSVPARVLQTVRGAYSSSSSSSRSGKTGAAAATGSVAVGQPCGGPAGVLCSAGSYCDLSGDPKSGIGVCKGY